MEQEMFKEIVMNRLSAFAEAHRSLIKMGLIWGALLVLTSVFLYSYGINPAAILFVIIAILSMTGMRYVPWLGIELCFFFTVYCSMVFGIIPGIIVGKVSNIVGITLAGQVDQNIFYDFAAFFAVAIIASMFPIQNLRIVAFALLALYHIGYVSFNKLVGSWDSQNLLYAITNIAFNAFVIFFLSDEMISLAAVLK
ncbi:hypothetical protein HZB03_03420 [Candidatus Woesearchaeota archaeon]|nr:hypothetical protein [Candidatus Woesearchaeota archaeon]